jgi:hypothetical protein
MTVVFINCSSVPFLDLIMALRKRFETRTRNTLRAVVGRRVFLAETGSGHRPLVRCSAIIGEPVVVRSREQWEQVRPACHVPAGSAYDWTPSTKAKYLYPLIDVVPCAPFTPQEGVRHGRVYMEV